MNFSVLPRIITSHTYVRIPICAFCTVFYYYVPIIQWRDGIRRWKCQVNYFLSETARTVFDVPRGTNTQDNAYLSDILLYMESLGRAGQRRIPILVTLRSSELYHLKRP